MTAHARRALVLIAPLVMSLVTACRSPPTRLLTLEPVAGAGAARAYAGPALRVEGVHIPPSLDRIEIVTDSAPGELRLDELDHWAAPPARLVRQTLTEDLVMRLPEGSVIFPHLARSPGSSGLTVEILAISADRHGARLEASWSVSSADAGPESTRQSMTLRIDTPVAGAAATARALGALLAKLADRIAEDLVHPTERGRSGSPEARLVE